MKKPAFHKVVVFLPAVNPGKARVSIDGNEVKGLQSIRVDAGCNRTTVVQMEFLADVSGDVEMPAAAE